MYIRTLQPLRLALAVMRSTDENRNYLLESVEALANPVVNKVMQDGPIGSGLAGSQLVRVELPPLLVQLDEAIRGTIGIGGSGSLASQRNMLDSDALARFSQISSTIKDWCRTVHVRPTADAAPNLKLWYAAFHGTEAASKFYESQLNSWRGQIAQKLDPPKVWLQPGSCPVCAAETWWSKSTHEEYKFPLVVEYHETGPNLIQEARAMCRACEQVWSVRELAYLLEQAEAKEIEESA